MRESVKDDSVWRRRWEKSWRVHHPQLKSSWRLFRMACRELRYCLWFADYTRSRSTYRECRLHGLVDVSRRGGILPATRLQVSLQIGKLSGNSGLPSNRASLLLFLNWTAFLRVHARKDISLSLFSRNYFRKFRPAVNRYRTVSFVDCSWQVRGENLIKEVMISRLSLSFCVESIYVIYFFFAFFLCYLEYLWLLCVIFRNSVDLGNNLIKFD